VTGDLTSRLGLRSGTGLTFGDPEHFAIADLSPLLGEERKLDFGAARSVDDPGCVKTQKSKRGEE
jgi:hypothetical protein